MMLEDQGDNQRTEGLPQSRLGKAYTDIIQYIVGGKSPTLAETGCGNGRRQRQKRGDDLVHPLKVSLEGLYNGITKKLSLSPNVICSK